MFSIIALLAIAAASFAQEPQPPVKPSTPGQTTRQAGNLAGKTAKKANPAARKKPKPEPVPVDPEADRKRFDEAVAAATTAEKARLLRVFIDEFPDSELKEEAFSYLITARAVVGNELVQAGNTAAGIASFKLAVEEAPMPVPERMFNDIISKIPGNLFYGNHRPAAMELAQVIEKKVAASPKQLLAVAAFYLSIENGIEAKRVAEAAIAVDPNSAAGYQALGLAHRLNFDLEESAKAYAKAAELDAASVPARRSLAEMNRALGKPEAAVTIYREILASNESDSVARQGLILSLFDSGQQKEAEAELGKVLPNEPRNFALLTSVAYWYAANEQGDKAVEYAQKAVEIEPRYIWGHIVLARGLMKQKKPVDAERALLRARQYGNFPTLDYEIASARFQAGLYREAVEELQKSFTIKDGLIGTKLGGRIYKEEKTLQDLVAHERKASLLQPLPADNLDTSEKLRLLFDITRKLEQTADETEVAALADEFVKGTDKMKLHRQLHVANLLLQKNVALPKVAELVKASVGNVDAGLDVSAPGAAVMASELYESRSMALARNEVIVIPEVPRQTLSAILRGRIEELAGWTLYRQNNYPDAIVRLRRAVSVLPDKSAWWRSSMWRLGAALEADGKDKEALDTYIRSYVTDRPSSVRYGAIEALYRKVNGNVEGLEDKIGPNPLVASTEPKTVEQPKTAAPPEQNAPAKDALPAGTIVVPADPLKNLPRHVPVKSDASATELEKSSAAKLEVIQKTESGVNSEKPAVTKATLTPTDTETKNTETTSVTSAEQKPAADAAPPTAIEPAPVKEQPGTVDKKAEATGQPQTTPPEVKVTEKEKEISSDPAKNVSAEPIVVRIDTPPVQAEKGPETLKTEKDAAVVKQTEVKETVPETSAPPPVSKDHAIPPKVDENPAAKEPLSEPKPATEKTGDAKAETEQVRKEPSDPDATKNDKIPETQPPGSVQESPPKTDAPMRNDQSEPPPETKAPVKTEPAKKEPDPTLGEPLANADPQPVKPPDRVERKPIIIINDPFRPKEKPAQAKSLFDPVIIKIPDSTSAAKQKEGPAGKPQPEKTAASQTEQPSAESEAPSGAKRKRVVEGKEVISDQRCSIGVSQESIMLLSGGGSLGLRVTIKGEGSVEDVTASSTSSRDIHVRPEPLIDGVTARRFYVIKSVSDKTGIFQVNFESPCGKREVTVHVR